MKVLVCGGRSFMDHEWVDRELDELNSAHSISHIIHGAAPGADTLAGTWAWKRGVQQVICPAQWERLGKTAGPIRNNRMLELKPNLVIAFPGGPGTASMVRLTKAAGMIPIRDYSKGEGK